MIRSAWRTRLTWLRRPAISLPVAVACLSLAFAEPANACSVCYGAEGSNMTTGMNNGVITLLGFIAFVQFGFVGLFGSIWYRTRKLRRLRKQYRVIEGER